MNPQLEIETKLQGLKPILTEKFHVDKIGYFGSYARNDQNKKSDIDILVSFTKPLGWEFFDLQDLLEEKLQLKVDLVSVKALKSQLKDIILNSVIYV